MSDRATSDTISPVRDIRPSEDLSLLHIYELRHVFEAETVAALGLIEQRTIREPESFRPISAPLPSDAPDRPVAATKDPASPYLASRASRPEPTRAGQAPETAAAVGEAEAPRRDWLLHPEPIPASVEAQRYGDDPARMRELVQWFADGRAASASVLVPRQAGDLVEGAPAVQERPHRLRALTASARTG